MTGFPIDNDESGTEIVCLPISDDTTTDYETWYRDGIAYKAKDEEIEEESFACKDKYNLKITALAAHNPSYTVAMGIRDDLIIDQELYEYLVGMIEQERSGCPKYGTGCPNTDC